jgi:hypothetical protein
LFGVDVDVDVDVDDVVDSTTDDFDGVKVGGGNDDTPFGVALRTVNGCRNGVINGVGIDALINDAPPPWPGTP